MLCVHLPDRELAGSLPSKGRSQSPGLAALTAVPEGGAAGHSLH